MATKINEALKISEEKLEREGIFNGFVDIDSKFYVDPHLLEFSTIQEFAEGYKAFKKHFEDIVKLLDATKDINDRFFREAVKRLIFKEIPYLGLGYAKNDVSGSGIGEEIAKNLAKTAMQIIEEGIKDPTFFELVGLIEKNIGPDRISDMTTKIIQKNIIEYNQRKARELGLKTKNVKFRQDNYSVPYNTFTGRIIFLLPKSILRNLPIAHDWSEVDFVAAQNQALRNKVNKIIGNTWKDATKK
ncbi:MAG TPA: hypothetical protein VE912_14565 [Bacteroidales bacterium]|nr:hypothetical protein [Bacteroidales bacterium]